MLNVTLNAPEELIAVARERAKREGTTLNEQFRKWLTTYARPEFNEVEFNIAMDAVRAELTGKLNRKFTRDEMNERR